MLTITTTYLFNSEFNKTPKQIKYNLDKLYLKVSDYKTFEEFKLVFSKFLKNEFNVEIKDFSLEYAPYGSLPNLTLVGTKENLISALQELYYYSFDEISKFQFNEN